jgi:hypothetical protein
LRVSGSYPIPFTVKITKHGTWKRDHSVMVRLNEAVHAEVAMASAESRQTVAEIIANKLADWAVRRTTERTGYVEELA